MLEEKTIDRNQVIGFLLIAGILLAMTWWAGNQEVVNVEVGQSNTVENSEEGSLGNSFDSSEISIDEEIIMINDSVISSEDLNGVEEIYILENDKVRYTFNSVGAQLVQVELKNYNNYRGDPLYLVDGGHKISGANKGVFKGVLEKKIKGRESLSMKNNDGIEWVFSLGTGYGLQWYLSVPGEENISLKWSQDGIRHEKSLTNENQYTTTYFFDAEDEKKDYLSNGKDDEDIASNISWVAHKQQFFSSIWTSDKPFSSVQLATTTPAVNDSGHTRQFRSVLQIAGENNGINAQGLIYHGPNQYLELKSFDKNFDEIIPFGWGIFGWISKGIVVPMFNLMEGFGWNYGLIIFLMALIIKLALSPLTFASYKSMAKMRLLKP